MKKQFTIPRRVKKSSGKLGLPPGALVFVGEEKTGPARITAIDYDEQQLTERSLSSADEMASYREMETTTWLNVDGIHDVETIRRIGELFDIHRLVLEDIVHPSQRPKVEAYDDMLFIVLKMLYYEEEQGLRSEQVSLIVGPHYVLSFQEREGDVFEPLRNRLRAGQGQIRRRGTDYLAYALLDMIVDHYFVVLETFSDLTEALEDEVLEDPSPEEQQSIGTLRRELIYLRRSVWPVRELFMNLERSDSPLITDETRPYLRDAYDHTVQIIDLVESLRDVLAGLTDLYLSGLSNKMNEIMKFLTIIGTIFIPLTFVAGIYGMNFEYMPELRWHYSYPVALGGMVALALILIAYFKKKRWL